MKKSLIALAVLAASGAAMAQSSVTLFGRVDASLGQTKTETTGAVPAASVTQTQVNSSTFNTTYWGMKGTEDLGGGLKANFELQSGFAIDTGVGNTGLFERLATVGFSGDFGKVNLGRQYTTQYSLFAATDNIGNANVSTTGGVWGAVGIANLSTRASNSIRYDSPKFSGVSLAAIYALGEDKTSTTSSNDLFGLSINYAAGPLMVGYGHQEEDKSATVTNKYDLIGGTYDFGAALLNASYQKAKNGTLNDKEYNFGVSVPVSTTTTIAFGYSKSNSKADATGVERSGKGMTLAGTYSLSKRTKLYASYLSTETESGAAVSTKKTTGLATGVVHLF